MSRTLIPRAYMATILSSSPSMRVWPLPIRRGSKLPSRSRGTSISKAPASPFTVLRPVPFRRFGCTGGGVSPGS